MKGKYKFLWGNTQSAITIESNIICFSKYKSIPWNNAINVLEFAVDNKISCYHSIEDLERDEKEGVRFLDLKFTKKFLAGVEDAYKKHKVLFKEMRKFDYGKMSDKEIIQVLEKAIDCWIYSISYFRGSQEAPSKILIQKINEKVSDKEFSILALPTEIDDIKMESLDWNNILRKKWSEEVIIKHLYEYPWLASYHFNLNQAIHTLKQRYDIDKLRESHINIRKDLEELKEKQQKIINKGIKELVNTLHKIALSRIKLKSCWAGNDFYLIPLYDEIARRSGEKVEDLIRYYLFNELKELLLSNRKVSEEEKMKRKKCFAFLWEKGIITIKSGKEAEMLVSKELANESVNEEVFGKSANKGIVTGKVCILYANDHIKSGILRREFKKGDILVTEMTQPNIMDIAGKAGAIITDEGGMLSHAAIISRELGIPCIVGTGNSTKLLKDGMFVEVDADTGVVRILDKKN